MGEYIISLAIFAIISVILIGIGISQIRSKEAVGFYNHEKPPRKEELIDVEEWNKKHGLMWITYGVLLIGVHIICIIISDAIVAFILLNCVIFVPFLIMMWYHSYLKKRYYR